MKSDTVAVHGGYETDPTTRAVAVPIYQTVAYEFDSADHGAALFNLEVEGHRYSRISNPTTAVLERRVAELEGGLEALCVGSGQAALNYALLNLAEIGSNIVSIPQLYGTTHTLFAHILPGQGIAVRFAETDRADAIEKLIDDNTRAIFCESVGNPAGNICDIEALAAVAARHGIPLVVDNTVATPILLRPIDYGADIVVHSLTKFMGGHGTTLGGAIIDSGRFPWKAHARRFPMFNTPDPSYHGLIYTEHFGAAAYIARCRSVYLRTTGAVLAPISSFLLLQGIETVALRVERHVENARRVAEFLRRDKRVAWLNYAGFADNPYHALAQKYLDGRACSILTFGIEGGFPAGKAFYDALKLFKRLVNMGDAKSLACHPASTTHRQMSAEQQAKAGVRPEMIRLSVGIEHIDDIIADLDQALAAAHAPDAAQLVAAELSPGRTRPMPLLADIARAGSSADLLAANALTIGLVNNMPDAAFEATERQFLDLIAAVTPDVAVRFALFSIPEVPRADALRAQLASRYHDVAELWDTRLDGLIVTGTEPRAAKLTDEPYWPAMTKLIDWTRDHTASTIWSCLAAHAVVLYADGIERQPLEEKLFGVFDYDVTATHPLTTGIAPLRVPHSRYNDVPAAALMASGYTLLSRSKTTGVDGFLREECGGSLFVFFQGHPEYDTNSLAREYRRDVGRYLRGEREHYPAAPQGYLAADVIAPADRFRLRAINDRRAELLADFPMAAIETGLGNSWRRSAVGIYRNWIDLLQLRRTQQRTSAAPVPRAPRRIVQGSRRIAG